MPDFQTDELDGRTVEGADGSKIGSVSGVFLDAATDKPEWVLVKTGMFGSKEALIPLAAASRFGDTITVPFDKDRVKGAPHHDPDTELSQSDEAELFQYYGVPYGGDTVTATGAPAEGRGNATSTAAGTAATGTAATTGTRGAGHDTSGPDTDDAMTRSEERLRVGTASTETGRARLRKYVVTEQVTQTVPVSHEEVRVEREPITEANMPAATDGPAISEEEHEVVLHGEQVVTEKETVPVERVRLGVDTVTEDQQVDESVRKERIEADGDTDRTGR